MERESKKIYQTMKEQLPRDAVRYLGGIFQLAFCIFFRTSVFEGDKNLHLQKPAVDDELIFQMH